MSGYVGEPEIPECPLMAKAAVLNTTPLGRKLEQGRIGTNGKPLIKKKGRNRQCNNRGRTVHI